MAKNPDFKVMLAKPYDPKRIKDWSAVSIEPKLDGVRVLIFAEFNKARDKWRITYYSRNGRKLLMFRHLDSAMKKMAKWMFYDDLQFSNGAVFDGEMVSRSGKFTDIGGAIHRKDHDATYAQYFAFSVIPLKAFAAGIDVVPQMQRLVQLRKAVLKHGIDDSVVAPEVNHARSDREVQATYQALRKRGVEGAMVKLYNEPWQGKRSFAWMKMKQTETDDVRVVSLKPGKGKYAGSLGALVCERLEGSKARVQVSGMTDAQRHEWWKSPSKIVGKVIEVEYHEATETKRLRHPRFKCFRKDKE